MFQFQFKFSKFALKIEKIWKIQNNLLQTLSSGKLRDFTNEGFKSGSSSH